MVANMIRLLRARMALLAVDEAGMSTVEYSVVMYYNPLPNHPEQYLAYRVQVSMDENEPTHDWLLSELDMHRDRLMGWYRLPLRPPPTTERGYDRVLTSVERK